jgi:oligopeptide transport system substrate-binding protein
MKKLVALFLAMAVVVCCFASCGNKNKGTTDSLSVCLASEPDTLDPALNSAVDGATMLVQMFAGLAKWEQDAKGNAVIVADCAVALPEGVVNADGTVTYTYTLKDGLKWSDGVALKASDFVFAWNRAASVELAADYGYMFDVIDGYADIWAEEPVAGAKLNVTAPDDKTIVVTLSNSVAYWNELLAFPTYFPVREDVVANEGWATEASTYVCNGAYVMDSWTHDSVIVLKKNPNYHNADAVTMPELKCYLSDDANNMLTNFKNGTWLLIDDVPTAEIPALKTQYPSEFVIAGQIGTYYVCWNVNEEILPAGSNLTGAEKAAAEAEIRNAISLLLDRNYIADSVAQGGQAPASTFVPSGMTEEDGTEFYKNTGVSDKFDGYYSVKTEDYEANFASAVATLKKYYNFDEATQKFTNVPTIKYLYNTGEGHKAIAEYIQGAVAAVGINMTLTNQEWNTFLNTRKDGDYSVARNGWVADYNDPISFLDMWTSGSGNNDVQFGKGAHKDLAIYDLDLTALGYNIKVEDGTWAETYDVLISEIKSCKDAAKRYDLMHIAEDMIMATGCITPIYYYTDVYMIDSSVEGFFSIPLGYKFFMYTTINK